MSRGLAGEEPCMATGMELQACLGGLSAALAALAVLEGPGRILAAGGMVTLLCPPGRTVQVLLGTPVLHSWCRVLGWVGTRSVAVDQRSQGSVGSH